MTFGQSSFASRVPLYTAIDIHPSGFIRSRALGVSGGQQVGDGTTENGLGHALFWRGSAASVVDLVSGFEAEATATCGGQQVGHGDRYHYRHALLWRGSAASVVDLNPSGVTSSEALGTSGREQVGFGIPDTGGGHALLWHGSATSVVDLNPSGFIGSRALGTDGRTQVEWGVVATEIPEAHGVTHHALLWRGSADSVVDLTPRGFIESEATSTSSGQQVGSGYSLRDGLMHALLWRGSAASMVDLGSGSMAKGTNGREQVGFSNEHAVLWHGTAASVVDLHVFLPQGFESSDAWGIDAVGDIVGSASGPEPYSSNVSSHAILWRRNVLEPSISRQQNIPGC